VIQCEYLAIVFTLKQCRHYILGKRFKVDTDHAPLKWLSEQKMEGMLCCWALAMQEFSFKIVYRKGSANTNADTLSCLPSNQCAATVAMPSDSLSSLKDAQLKYPIISQVQHTLSQSSEIPSDKMWNHPLPS